MRAVDTNLLVRLLVRATPPKPTQPRPLSSKVRGCLTSFSLKR